jgi:hypothetical protein
LFSLGLTSIIFKSKTVANNLKLVVDSWPVTQLFRAIVLSLTKQQRLEQRKFAMQQISSDGKPKKKGKQKAEIRHGVIS